MIYVLIAAFVLSLAGATILHKNGPKPPPYTVEEPGYPQTPSDGIE